MKHLLIIIAIISLSACYSLGSFAVETAIIDKEVRSGALKENLEKVDLTQVEEQIITHALNSVLHFRQTYGSLIGEPGKLLAVNPAALERDYAVLRTRYSEVRDIIFKNFHKYDQETQNTFIAYQDHAEKLDVAVSTLLSQKAYKSAISNALSYAFTSLQLVAALK